MFLVDCSRKSQGEREHSAPALRACGPDCRTPVPPQTCAAPAGLPAGLVAREVCLRMDALDELLPTYKELFNVANDIVHPLRAATGLVFDITAPISSQFGILSK